MASDEFNPDWASPPGDTIKDILQERGMSVSDFIAAMNLDSDQVAALLNGGLEVTADIAAKLKDVFNVPQTFWLRREEQYRKQLKRIEKSIRV